MPRVTVEAAGETASVDFTEPVAAILAGALPLGQANYGLNGTLVSPGGFKTAVTNAVAGATLVLRGGVYNEQVSIPTNKPLTIQAYPGEVVWIDGKTNLQWAMIVKSKITLRGIGFRNFSILNEATYERGLLFPSGADGTLIENCWFVDFGDVAMNIYSNSNVVVQYNSWLRAGENHLWSNLTNNLIVRNNHFKDANTKLLPMAPTIACQKHHRSNGLVIRDNVIDGVPKAAGIWLDESNYDSYIINNDITNVGGDCVMVEASAKAIVAGNRGQTTGQVGLRAVISSNVEFWNNATNGATAYQMGIYQDQRRAPSSTPHYPEISWISHDVEFCNNLLGSTHAQFMMLAQDYYTGIPADNLWSRIEGNVFSTDANGYAPKMIGWGTGAATPNDRVTYTTIAQARAAKPAIVLVNYTSTEAMPTGAGVVGASIPADVAALMGVAAGSTVVGPQQPAPVVR